ncbi:bifunctional diguanylate cyclase/phosphodiesterase [Colwellia sp. UCD-KL20]|uniref:putative bifunctional diguanylate cyclase/phosphodiesterase n=1 Tax=Colwellia sp. UCD-KL20 TaxID=1917165 RepID=UPI000970B9BA|nr:bifunctional diguanylate cyclase/phosphodiesterase [Colwellia sp. UCD-KL20]
MLVLNQRHSQLFLVLCFIPVVIFSVVHFLKGNFLLAFSLVSTSIVFAINFKSIKDNKISNKNLSSIIISMWCCLALSSYYIGLHGIFYTFPSIVGLFFLVSIRLALLISIPSIFIFLALTILHGEQLDTLKLASSFILTIIFTAYSAYFSRHQKDARDQESKKDPLTGVANRHGYNEWLDECHANTNITSITSITLDIDNFRIINDTFGFDTGDKLIQQLAGKLLNIIEKEEIIQNAKSQYIARLSGDEFIIGLTNLPEELDIIPLVGELKLAVSQLSIMLENPTKIFASVAVVRTNRLNGKFTNIIDNLDMTMRHAKQLGKNKVQIFEESLGKQFVEQKYIAKELAQALKNNQFHMVFMPIFCSAKKVVGAELLLRCDREELSEYGPDTFIPVAESYGLIEEIDFWVLNESFNIITKTDILKSSSIDFFSINISANQLRNKEFVPRIKELVDRYRIDPYKIELEITETSLVETDLQVIEILVALRRIDFRLSLDDFGTGFTSFNQLKKYPLNCLKIDRSFVSGDIENLSPLRGMSDVILSIAKLHNFDVIAEGVETEQQYIELKNNGCLYFQGYWFSKPLTEQDFVHFLVHTHDE